MVFGTDEQTIYDLNIFPKYGDNISIFDFYNLTITKGGRNKLEQMLGNPICDLVEINNRISAIKYIKENKISCKLNNDYLDFIEFYLSQNTPILQDNFYDSISAKILYEIKPSNEYYIIQRGLEYLKHHLIVLSEFLQDIDDDGMSVFFRKLSDEIKNIKDNPEFMLFLKSQKQGFTFRQINHYDSLIRKSEKETIKKVLKLTYELDVYLSIAYVSIDKGLEFPNFLKESKPFLKLNRFFHPLIEKPIKNNFETISNKNFCFVSGANMSGKSTFLKTVGLCVYLAHIGFPVPAKEMELSMFNGFYSSINISDNINKGYSHYYSEVKRVKEVALKIKEKRKVLVIFDELFRGTNVKDAFDATLMVSKGFSEIKESLFFISTHIVEVGEELKKNKNIDFKCFLSSLNGEELMYNHKLNDGISNERLGLTILKNEKVIDIIRQINT